MQMKLYGEFEIYTTLQYNLTFRQRDMAIDNNLIFQTICCSEATL